MTRPRKATVNYFPHFCHHGKTIFTLENKFGLAGYCFFFKVLELLGTTENHFINCNDSAQWEYLQAYTHLDEETVTNILNTLSNLKSIDSDLWSRKIIWSENFISNLEQTVYARRDTKPIGKEELLQMSHSAGLNVTEIPLSGTECDINPAIEHNYPQSKVNKSKVKEVEEREGVPKGTLSTDLAVDRTNGFKISNLAELWNEKAPPELARVSIPFKRSPKKLKPMIAMVSLYPELSWWEGLIAKTYHSSFLRGKNSRGWKATFDFIVSKADEINDGKYIDIGGANQTEQGISTAYSWAKNREAKRNGTV